MSEQLYQVDVGHACYGLAIEAGRVIDAAPIARWMIGKKAAYVMQWLKRKGAAIAAAPGA